MIDDQRVVNLCQTLDRPVGKLLEGAFLPPNLYIRIKLREPLSSCDHWQETARMIPGDAPEVSHTSPLCPLRVLIHTQLQRQPSFCTHPLRRRAMWASIHQDRTSDSPYDA